MFGVLRNRRGKAPVFRRGMQAPAFAFIIQWYLVNSYYVDIQVKLYSSKRNRKIDAMLREACFVWNHALALQKRYYRLTGRYCSCSRMKHHFLPPNRPMPSARPDRSGDIGAAGCRLPAFLSALVGQTAEVQARRAVPKHRVQAGRVQAGLQRACPEFHKAALPVLVLPSLRGTGQADPDQAQSSRRVLPVHRYRCGCAIPPKDTRWCIGRDGLRSEDLPHPERRDED